MLNNLFCRNIQLFNTAKSLCEKWIAIYPKSDSKSGQDFIKMLRRVSQTMGFNMGAPKECEILDSRTPSYVAKLKEVAE